MRKRSFLMGNFVVMIGLLLQLLEKSEAGAIYTVYGKQATSGSFSGDGGQASAATFKTVQSTWIGAEQVAYLADRSNYRIRKVDSSGIISTFFGGGADLGNEGAATSAYGTPYCVFSDSVGNVYFSEQDNSRVRKIDTNQIVHAVGGTGSEFPDSQENGSSATNAYLASVSGIAIDLNGDVYMAVYNRHRVEKITVSTGIMTYVGGTGLYANKAYSVGNGDGGPATSAKITYPLGIYLDTIGYLYTSCSAPVVRKIDLVSGTITAYAGTDTYGYKGDGGPATSAVLGGQYALAYGDTMGTLYYVSALKNTARYIDCSGIINRYAGDAVGLASGYSGDGGEATAALLYYPWHVFVLDSTVYITDTRNNVVRKSVTHQSGASCDSSTSPSVSPTAEPSFSLSPTVLPSTSPSAAPSIVPSVGPSVGPSVMPTISPSVVPSTVPTATTTYGPTLSPTLNPTVIPTVSSPPTSGSTIGPTVGPTTLPTGCPSNFPIISALPTMKPSTGVPSRKPSVMPSFRPSRAGASTFPTALPSVSPTVRSVVISFNSSLNLHNVTAPVRRRRLTVSDGALLDDTAQTAVTNAVAVILDIDDDQVSFVSQQLIGTEDGTRRRQLSAGQQTYDVLVVVNVVASTRDFVGTMNQNGSFLYNFLALNLLAAVESSEFAVALRDQSASLGSLATLYVDRVNVTLYDFADITSLATVDNDDHHNDSSDYGLNAGAIAGIAIAGVIMVVICGFVMLRHHRKRDSKVAAAGSSTLSA